MQRTFYRNTGSIIMAFTFRNIGAMYLRYFTVAVLYYVLTLDDVSAFQPYHLSGRQAEKLLGRVLHEIFSFNIQLTAERNFTVSGIWIFRIILALYHFK